MVNNAYHFITQWRVQSTVAEVRDILGDAEALSRWWPSVYIEVKMLERGDEDGIGRKFSLYTKGWLPYTLRWDFVVTEAGGSRLALAAEGDFVGRGVWTLAQDGEWVNITYDWNIRAQKPLLRTFSFLLKPVFSANHRWAMRMGEASLKLEIARRHAQTPEELSKIPNPPPRTPSSLLKFIPFLVMGSRT